MIENLRIENFRGITSLELNGLKRVSLVVGQNNSGKTSLLEAVRLICEPGKIGELPTLFRPLQGSHSTRYYRWLVKDSVNAPCRIVEEEGGVKFKLEILPPDKPKGMYTLKDEEFVSEVTSPLCMAWSFQKALSCRVISVLHRDHSNLVTLLGKAYRKKDGEETLQRLLAKVDPRIKKVRIDPGEDGNQVIVDIGLSELIPITQAGQGVYRLVWILADIIGETPEVLLIDEIENGLHHSVQKQIWAGLAEIAESLDVQIIATTHSGECLEAAHRAFSERTNYDLSVIQLFRVPEGVQGRVLDRELIEAALEGDIDLR